jgi:hypothetical protein
VAVAAAPRHEAIEARMQMRHPRLGVAEQHRRQAQPEARQAQPEARQTHVVQTLHRLRVHNEAEAAAAVGCS